MTIDIIPAIDVIGGKCVRLTRGDYSTQKVYNESPLDVARAFEDAGCRRLHLVDLDGAKSKHIVNYGVLESIAGHTSLCVDFGGGLKSDDDLRIAFESGASMVTGGSIAVTRRDMFLSWLSRYGTDKIILGADSRGGRISTNGWTDDSDETLLDFISGYVAEGVTQVISTDISKDGMLGGSSVELYEQILAALPKIRLVASGGVGCWNDIEALDKANVPAVIVGKAIYEGRITLNDLEQYNCKKI